MKRILAALLAAVILIAAFTGCSSSKKDSGKLKIIATIFPEYDWVKNIVGDVDNAEVSLLLDKGVDMHSYEPTADDIVNVSSCDVFIYVGGESDKWVDDALKTATNKDMVAINLLDELGSAVKEEEIIEGMEAVEEEEEGDETEYDEHVWLSLKNASTLCQVIADKLGEKDSANKDAYDKNAKEYITKLNSLDTRYSEMCKSAKNKTLIFADRFPFRYMTDDYGLKYYAAFTGCSAESEASFKTIVFLAEKLDELNLKKLIIIDGSDKKIANAVADTALTETVELLPLDSMQSAIDDGDTYLSIMEENYEVLKDALN